MELLNELKYILFLVIITTINDFKQREFDDEWRTF